MGSDVHTVHRHLVVSPKAAVVQHCTDPAPYCPLQKESGFESSSNGPNECCDESPCSPNDEFCPQQITFSCARISINSFKFVKKLGSGGYGRVLLVQKRSGRDRGCLYAMKVMNLSRAALVERDIMPRLQGLPYTTDLAYAFYDSVRAKTFLVMAYSVGKDLFSLAGSCRSPGYLRRMFLHNYPKYIERIRIVIAELVVAIIGLHSRRIMYRDLKLENILIHGDGHIRLADFGLSRCFEPGETCLISGKTGTPDYMAPEVILSSGSRGPATKYSYEADLWGLGVIAYELIVGQLPFKGREVPDLEESILHDSVELPGNYMEQKFKLLTNREKPLLLAAFSFIKGLLLRDPKERLSAADIPNHVFFRDLDWRGLSSGEHDEPPFDVRRILSERPDVLDADRHISLFSGAAEGAKVVTTGSGFENPAKYAHYSYDCGGFGWLPMAECRFAGDDSQLQLPDDVCPLEPDDDSSRPPSCLLHQLPGLQQFELAAAEDADSSQEEELPRLRKRRASRSAAVTADRLVQLPPKKRGRFRKQLVGSESAAIGCSPLPPFSSFRTRASRVPAR